MKVVFQVFDKQYCAGTGANSLMVFNTKIKNISEKHAKDLIEIAITKATKYASLLINKNN